MLLNKLNLIDLSPQYIKSYSRNRSFQIEVKYIVSPVAFISNGIPHGSSMEPLLFNAFIDDLCDAILFSTLLVYVDDFKLVRKIRSTRKHSERHQQCGKMVIKQN